MRLKTIGLIATLALGILTTPPPVQAQQLQKVPRIGILPPGPISARLHLWEAFRQGLRELGYVEGKNIALEFPSEEVKPERLADLAADLVRRKVDIIVAATNPAIQAARQATRTIPIIMASSADPVETGLVVSLSRPGGNVTGLTLEVTPETYGKRLELLKEVVPKASRVAVLWNPTLLLNAARWSATEGAA